MQVRHLLTAGAVHECPFGRPRDRFGLAIGWGTPQNSTHRNQGSAEIFYRVSIGRILRITPHIQLFIHPGKSKKNTAGLVGLRGRMTF